jgi:hypothetical protein
LIIQLLLAAAFAAEVTSAMLFLILMARESRGTPVPTSIWPGPVRFLWSPSLLNDAARRYRHLGLWALALALATLVASIVVVVIVETASK